MTGDELKSRRKALNLNQEDLGKLLGDFTQTTIWRWESGKVAIPPYLDRALRDLERELKQKSDSSKTP